MPVLTPIQINTQLQQRTRQFALRKGMNQGQPDTLGLCIRRSDLLSESFRKKPRTEVRGKPHAVSWRFVQANSPKSLIAAAS